jgi:hypothetical protein
MLDTIIGLGQLGALVEIARRLGSIRADVDGLKERVSGLETEVFGYVYD